jgi:putative ATPase
MADLFDAAASDAVRAAAPLADRVRPAALDGFIGQAHLIGPGTALRRAIEEDRVPSSIFYGAPGTGKTTLARIIAHVTGAEFEELSAVQVGKADVTAVIGRARERLGAHGRRTILFLDEIHRFNKAQQDALLPVVESGLITLIGATTENPYFEINSALLSRCALFEFLPHTPADLTLLVERGAADLHAELGEGMAGAIAEAAGGDARAALAILELATSTARSRGVPVGPDEVAEAAIKRPVRFDRDGDVHFDVASAFIKSMRGSDPDAAIYWLAVMIAGGEDPKFIARRVIIFASEDVGNADPRALEVAVAAARAVEFVGLPEARINLAQAVAYVALAPKSNAAISAIDAALAEVRRSGNLTPPASIRDAHYPGARPLGRGAGYVYPHRHGGFEPTQRYLPDELGDRRFYEPSQNGFEARLSELLEDFRRRRDEAGGGER